MNIKNLTRIFIPKLSQVKAENINAINAIPEIALANAIAQGDKSIVKVGMNQTAAVRMSEKGINTLYTDGLAGCNATLIVAKGLDGKPISIMSHYTPLKTSRELNYKKLEEQLNTYDHYIDKKSKPKVFFNLKGEDVNGIVKETENPIVKELEPLFKKFFKQGYKQKVIPYSGKSNTPFDSNAFVAQFGGDKMKLTTVKEKEHFIDLMG